MGTGRQREQAGAAGWQLRLPLLLFEVEILWPRFYEPFTTLKAATGRWLNYAAFLWRCGCFPARLLDLDLALPLCSRLCCNTATRSITFVGLGAFFGLSSMSSPPCSTFSSITFMTASR